MNTTIPMNRLTSQDLEEMVLKMCEEGLSASAINSYTRTLKVFFSWCNEEGHSHFNIKLYKAPETVNQL
jgi:integrase/recombinase XerD